MIPAREILNLRAEWSLDVGVIEKDYVLGWLLAGIANHPKLSPTWVFKGGTCLHKCSYETYRFSEDLDFTVVDGGPETPDGYSGRAGMRCRVKDRPSGRPRSGREVLTPGRSPCAVLGTPARRSAMLHFGTMWCSCGWGVPR